MWMSNKDNPKIRNQENHFKSFRRKPESSFPTYLKVSWTPVFTGVTTFFGAINYKKTALFFLAFLWSTSAIASELRLQDLIQEVMKNNPEIQAAQAGVDVAQYKIPQAGALPDPMVDGRLPE